MNTTKNVNIGGFPFVIDDDAYDILRSYLDRLHHHFSKSEGCEEIVHDIELRFAELLNERPERRPIITTKDVNHVIQILGTPEDIGAETEEIPRTRFDSTHQEDYEFRRAKRLFRDPEDKVVSGVCSGLSAYFGIHDPIWVRIGFLVFGVSTGVGVLIYLVLASIVPKAKTPMDRLAMRGEPINVESIARQVEEGFEEITGKFDEMSDRWRNKKKRR